MNRKYIYIIFFCVFFISCGKKETVKDPIFSIEEGVYKEEIEIYIDDRDSIIYYTLNGSDPTPKMFSKNILRYNSSNPIKIKMGEKITIKAIGTKAKSKASNVVSKTYEVRETLPNLESNIDIFEGSINRPIPLKVFYSNNKYKNTDIEIRYEEITTDSSIEVTTSSTVYNNEYEIKKEGEYKYKFKAFSKENKYFPSKEKLISFELKYTDVAETYFDKKSPLKLLEKQKLLGTVYDEEYMDSIIEKEEIYVISSIKKNQENLSLLIKADKNGNMIFQKILDVKNPKKILSKNDEIIIGFENSLFLLDKKGIIKKIIDLDFELVNLKYNQNLIALGLDKKTKDMTIKEIDDDFKIINEKTYKSKGFDIPKEIFVYEDEYYLIFESDNIVYNTQQIDIIIAKIDKNFNIISTEKLGGNYIEYYNSSFISEGKLYILLTTTSDMLVNKKGELRPVLYQYDIDTDTIDIQDTSFSKKDEIGEDIKIIRDNIYILLNDQSNLRLITKNLYNSNSKQINVYKDYEVHTPKKLILNNFNTVDVFYTSTSTVDKSIGSKDIVYIQSILE